MSDPEQPPRPAASGLRVAFVPGVTLRKWTARWHERRPSEPLVLALLDEAEAEAAVRDGDADVAFVRLPVDREGLHVIRLYEEAAVLVVSRDSELSLEDALTVERVAGLEGVVERPSDAKAAVELVAAGVGSVRLPQSIARLHARKDVVPVPITDAAPTEIALVWPEGGTTPDIDEFVGVVRGRTAQSSRGTAPAEQKPRTLPRDQPRQHARRERVSKRRRPSR